MKKFLSSLAFAVIFMCDTANAMNPIENKGTDNRFIVTINGNGVGSITGGNGNNQIQENNIVFEGGDKNSLKSLTIPSWVKSIKPKTFDDCQNLEKIQCLEDQNGQSELTEIWSFEDCLNLFDILLPKGLKIIGGCTFSRSKITSINIPETVFKIGIYAFMNCRSLEKVVFDGQSVLIEFNGFTDCDNLKQIQLPPSVKYIGKPNKEIARPNDDIDISSVSQETLSNCGFETFEVPAQIEEFYGFGVCAKLKSFTFAPNSKIRIFNGLNLNNDFFAGIQNNSFRVDFPYSLKEVGGFSFFKGEIILPKTIKSIQILNGGGSNDHKNTNVFFKEQIEVTDPKTQKLVPSDKLTPFFKSYVLRVPKSINILGGFIFCRKLIFEKKDEEPISLNKIISLGGADLPTISIPRTKSKIKLDGIFEPPHPMAIECLSEDIEIEGTLSRNTLEIISFPFAKRVNLNNSLPFLSNIKAMFVPHDIVITRGPGIQ